VTTLATSTALAPFTARFFADAFIGPALHGTRTLLARETRAAQRRMAMLRRPTAMP